MFKIKVPFSFHESFNGQTKNHFTVSAKTVEEARKVRDRVNRGVRIQDKYGRTETERRYIAALCDHLGVHPADGQFYGQASIVQEVSVT